MINKEWILNQDSAGTEKLVLVGHNFLEPDYGAKITIYLRKIFTDANGVERSNVSAYYSVQKGVISYDIDGMPLPKKDLHGNIIYKEDGVTPQERDNAYDNIVYYVDNKIMSVYKLIDEGVKERFKIVVE